jgi:hypothetical protein
VGAAPGVEDAVNAEPALGDGVKHVLDASDPAIRVVRVL